MTAAYGVILSVASSCLFGALYYLATLLHPLTGTEMFGWRMLLALPFLTGFMLLGHGMHHVRAIGERVRREPLLLPGLCLSSALNGVQQWLFLWAPNNGSAIYVSLGYFLLPLTILLTGRFLYRETLSRLQLAAAVMASVGIAHELFAVGAMPWQTLLVALGFPAYFVLRRKLGTDNLGGLWCDIALTAPVALWFVLRSGAAGVDPSEAGRLYLLLPLVGAMTAAAFMSYIMASHALPLGLFGLLGYVEPMLLFAVSVLIGEVVGTEDLYTYIPIVGAVALLAADGVGRLRSTACVHG